MKFIETLKLAVAAIWAHKLRSALTLLGMIVGVTAFVVVVSLIGIGAKSFTIQRFNPLEDFKDTDTIAAAQRRNKELTMDDYDYLKQRAQLIGKIGARARGTPVEVKRGNEVLEDVFVTGATANCVDIENRDVAEGRFIAEPEDEGAARVAYIGADVATKLFPNTPLATLPAGLSGPILTHPAVMASLAARSPLALSPVEGSPIEGVRCLLARA